jgi:hypothetical protein
MGSDMNSSEYISIDDYTDEDIINTVSPAELLIDATK